MAKKCTFCLEYKALCLWHIVKHGGGCIILRVCLSSARRREIFRIKINGKELSTGKIREEKPGSECWKTNPLLSTTNLTVLEE
jgi:hypothetical protein